MSDNVKELLGHAGAGHAMAPETGIVSRSLAQISCRGFWSGSKNAGTMFFRITEMNGRESTLMIPRRLLFGIPNSEHAGRHPKDRVMLDSPRIGDTWKATLIEVGGQDYLPLEFFEREKLQIPGNPFGAASTFYTTFYIGAIESNN